MVRLTLAGLLIGFLCAAPALALDVSDSGPDDPRIRRTFNRSGKTALWLTLGGNRYDRIYDQGGSLMEFGNDLAVTRLNGHVGASRVFFSAPLFSFALGVDMGLSRTSVEGDLNGGPDINSTLDAQSALVFGEVGLRYLSARFGYQFDLGPDPFGDRVFPNSDNQDAVFVSVTAALPVDDFRVFAGFDSYVTAPQTAEGRDAQNEMVDFEYDLGDHIVLHAGGGYAFGSAEVGLVALYRFRSKERFELPDGNKATGTSGRHLSVVPYAMVTLPTIPIELHARLAVEGEYGEYGFALAGENTSVTRASLTLGAVYAF